MKHNDKIEHQTNETMKMLDEKTSVPADPFFKTRLLARLNSRYAVIAKKQQPFAAFIKPALLAVLLSANLTTAYFTVVNRLVQNPREELMRFMADEYALDETDSDWFYQESER